MSRRCFFFISNSRNTISSYTIDVRPERRSSDPSANHYSSPLFITSIEVHEPITNAFAGDKVAPNLLIGQKTVLRK